MNKKDLAEIKKQYKKENISISRICACYVDGKKNKRLEFSQAFLTLSEEEIFKYVEIFKKTLGGTIGKNLLQLDFPTEEEQDEGTQRKLMALRDSQLKDQDLVDEFFDDIIEKYPTSDNYYMILVYNSYDIPTKGKDGLEIFDGSENVFNHILFSLCPVKLSKGGLFYNMENNHIEERIPTWLVEMPELGFMFPAFEDRCANIHSILYYSKNSKTLQITFIDDLLRCQAPLPFDSQQQFFSTIVENALGDECTYENILEINDKVTQLAEASKEHGEVISIGAYEMKQLLEDSGVPEEKIEELKLEEAITPEKKIVATNISKNSKYIIEGEDMQISIKKELAQLIETKKINGRNCIIIPMEGEVFLNGTLLSKPTEEL